MVQNLIKIIKKNIHFHHTGIITEDLKLSKKIFKDIGYNASKILIDKPQKSYVVLLSKKNSPIIELISPINKNSPAQGWIKRIGNGAYHVCYEIRNTDLNSGLNYFLSQKFMPVTKMTISSIFKGKNVIFLWGKGVGLIELIGKI